MYIYCVREENGEPLEVDYIAVLCMCVIAPFGDGKGEQSNVRQRVRTLTVQYMVAPT